MKINSEMLAILSRSICQGHILKLPQLSRPEYERINKILEAAGGKWDRPAGGHVFPNAADEVVDHLINEEEVVTQQEMGAFFSPPDIVSLIIDRARLTSDMLVLEPSAGSGNIAKEAAKFTHIVDCIEIQSRYAYELEISGLYRKVTEADFLTVIPNPVYDRVLMNPPFARRQDIDHVCHALKFLKPDGILISIMAAGVSFRRDNKTREFCTILDQRGNIEDLPDGAFHESGTDIRAVLVEIRGEPPKVPLVQKMF
jgi:hypothetical protein